MLCFTAFFKRLLTIISAKPASINKTQPSRLDRSDALEKIQGYIVKQINADTYEFKDSTGFILVDIDKKTLPTKPFNDKTELILIGEVDHDMLEPVEIEVDEVLFVN